MTINPSVPEELRNGTHPISHLPCTTENVAFVNAALHEAARMAPGDQVDACDRAVNLGLRAYFLARTEMPPTIQEYAVAVSQHIALHVT